MLALVRFSKENPNWEKGLEGKYGKSGEAWGSVNVIRNVVFVIAYPGASVTDYVLPEVYDGFLQCSDGTTVPVADSRFSLALGAGVSAQGILQLRKDN